MADQIGLIIIANPVFTNEKYLNAILYGVTDSGPNIRLIIRLEVVNSTKPAIWMIKNWIPKDISSLI